MSKHSPYQPMGQDGWNCRQLREQANITVRPLPSSLKSHSDWGHTLMTGSTQTLHAPFKNVQGMSRGVKGCAPEHVRSDHNSLISKRAGDWIYPGETVPGHTLSSHEERTGLLDVRRAVVITYQEASKVFDIVPQNIFVPKLGYYGLHGKTSR